MINIGWASGVSTGFKSAYNNAAQYSAFSYTTSANEEAHFLHFKQSGTKTDYGIVFSHAYGAAVLINRGGTLSNIEIRSLYRD